MNGDSKMITAKVSSPMDRLNDEVNSLGVSAMELLGSVERCHTAFYGPGKSSEPSSAPDQPEGSIPRLSSQVQEIASTLSKAQEIMTSIEDQS